MKLEIYDSVKFTLGFIFHKKNTMLVGDKLKDKSKNPFPYTTRKSYPTFPRPLKNVYKKKKKKHNYEQPDKEGPLPKKISNQKGYSLHAAYSALRHFFFLCHHKTK